jgi:multidrug resistance efflux pump
MDKEVKKLAEIQDELSAVQIDLDKTQGELLTLENSGAVDKKSVAQGSDLAAKIAILKRRREILRMSIPDATVDDRQNEIKTAEAEMKAASEALQQAEKTAKEQLRSLFDNWHLQDAIENCLIVTDARRRAFAAIGKYKEKIHAFIRWRAEELPGLEKDSAGK